MQSIAERLKILRGAESQQKFAKSIGLKQTTYGQYERGQNAPDADTLAAICRTLGVNPSWLLLGAGPMRAGDHDVGEKREFGLVDMLNKKSEREREEKKDEIIQKLISCVVESSEREVAAQKEHIHALQDELRKMHAENVELKRQLSGKN